MFSFYIQGLIATSSKSFAAFSEDPIFGVVCSSKTNHSAWSYPVFAFAHLMDPELLSAGTLGNLLLHFIIYPLSICQWSLALPVRTKCGDELLVVDVSVLVAVKYVGHCAHLQATGWELWEFDKRALISRLHSSNHLGTCEAQFQNCVGWQVYQTVARCVHVIELVNDYRNTKFFFCHFCALPVFGRGLCFCLFVFSLATLSDQKMGMKKKTNIS